MKQDTLVYQIYPLLTDEAVAEPTAIDGKPPNMHLDPIYTDLGYKKRHHKIQINACIMQHVSGTIIHGSTVASGSCQTTCSEDRSAMVQLRLLELKRFGGGVAS